MQGRLNEGLYAFLVLSL
jgi:hypothetical protein